MNFSNALYFLIGMTVSQSGLRFTQVFRATPLAIVPFAMLCCFPANLDRGTLAGITITWLSISLLLAAYGHLPAQARRLSFFIGRNTLVILLFSPIFTILSKAFLPVFAFDPTGMLFLVTATAFRVLVAGSTRHTLPVVSAPRCSAASGSCRVPARPAVL